MISTMRAGLSVLLLLGFYMLAFGLVGGLGWASLWFWQEHAGLGAAKLSWVTVALGFTVLAALWKVAKAKPEPPPGTPVGPDQAPELWHTVRELAAEAQTRPPDEILLIPDVNAAVAEETKLLGLIGGRRRLYLGVPLLQALSVGQLRAVIAHELGHYSGRHTSLGAVAYRSRMAIIGTVQEMGPRTLIGWLFKKYATLYVLVDNAASRRQELEADEASVRVAGRATAQSALRELPVIDAAWSFYTARYIAPGWEAGYGPRDFFGGFGRLLTARRDELARLRQTDGESEHSKWDTHPPIAVRVKAMEAMPDAPVRSDPRPGHSLIPMFDQLHAAIAEKTVDYGDRKIVSWDELTAAAVVAEEQRQADAIYRAAARMVRADHADLSTVFGLVEAGRLGELAEQFFSKATRREAARLFAEPLEVLLRLAAVRSGAGRWRHSWSGPATFARMDGYPLDLSEIAELATSPDTLDTAREHLQRLGIDVAKATQVEQNAGAHAARALGALADVKVNDVGHDVLILDLGLILKPAPGKGDKAEIGKKRLQAWLDSAPLPELTAQNWFVPFEEVTSAVTLKRVPVQIDLTLYDGRTLSLRQPWSGSELTKNSSDALLEIAKRLAPPTLARR